MRAKKKKRAGCRIQRQKEKLNRNTGGNLIKQYEVARGENTEINSMVNKGKWESL